MSSFAYNVVTSDGMNLIARATASHRLIITGSKSCTLAANSNADLASKALSWYDGKEGVIQSVSDNENVARIVARYTATGSQQTCKSICILAKIDGDADSVILCAISDPDANITLPGSTDLAQSIDFPFNVAVTENNSVETTPGASATLSDLDRFVSMYKNGNAGAGDDQNIRGDKTFLDSACFGNGTRKIYADSGIVFQTEFETGTSTYNPKITFTDGGNLNFNAYTMVSYTNHTRFSPSTFPGRIEVVENTNKFIIHQLNNTDITFDASLNLANISMNSFDVPVVQVGAIVYGIFGNITSGWNLPADGVIKIGQTITIPENGVMLAEYYTTSSTEGWRAATKVVSGQYQTLYLPTGTYKCLCQLDLTESSAFKNRPVLFMRVS